MDDTSSSSNASTSRASTSSTEQSRPEAPPLPVKRGEIGFNPELHENAEGNGSTSIDLAVLPARHPADRDAASLPSNSHNNTPTPSASDADRPTAAADAASAHSKRSFISFLKPKFNPTYGGVRLNTMLTVAMIALLLSGSIAAWVMTIKRLDIAQNMMNSDGGTPIMTALVFVHVLFAVVVLAQLIIFERWVFTLRAERYAYLHPGEILPFSHRSPANEAAVMGLSPWNRPPLPTYAATLAASGHGTGDVEDHIIAAPAPPAYGNTRGSTLLLTGYLRDSLRAQRPRSQQSQEGRRDEEDRPKSYASVDEEWEVIRDAQRANNLEQTLARLEEGSGRDSGGHV